MNTNESHDDFLKSLEETANLFFDGEMDGDDVSVESANRAGRMKPAETKKVEVFDTELGWVTETVTVSKNDHTITIDENDSEGVEVGSLTVVARVANDGETFTVWGWRNDSDLNDERGDCEVEIATFDVPEARRETYGDLTFTLTQQQIDDALALFDEIYLSDES